MFDATQITEPTTMITDYVLTAACAYFSFQIATRSARRGGRRTALWVAAFAVTALAALLGGTAHGFRIPLGDHWPSVWSATVASIGLSSLLLVTAGVTTALWSEHASATSRAEGVRWLERAILVTLVALAALLARVSFHEHFNQNDLYHVIQLIGLYALFRGSCVLHNLDETY